MIYFLNLNLQEFEGVSQGRTEELFNDLLDCSRKGKHLIVIKRSICDWAMSELGLSTLHQAHLIKIKEKFATTGGLISSAGAILEIVAGSQAVIVNANNRFQIGVEAFLLGSYCDHASALVVEDVHSDAAFYEHLLDETAKLSGVSHLSIDPVHGGGGATYRAIKREIDKFRVVVSIVDSDKRSPDDRYSETCRQSMKVHNDENYVGGVYPSVGHEMENVVPLSILAALDCYSDYDDYDLLNALVAADTGPQELSFWQFFDIKDGLSGEQINTAFEESKISEECYLWILDKINIEPENLPAFSITGFGNRVTQNLLKCGETLGKLHRYCRSNEWSEMYHHFFDNLIWFFCSSPKERT